MSVSTKDRGGLSVRTLAIASAASALATYLVPMIWRPGTIAAAAVTPVIVALISEALSRPAAHVSQAGRLVRVPGSRFDVRGLDPVTRRRLRLSLVTGLLAFVVAAVVITTTELATGEAVSSSQRTTLLGGESRSSSDEEREPADAPQATPPAPAATAVPEASPAAGGEPTPDPAAESTPTPVPLAPETTPPPPASAPPGATPAPVTP